MTPETLAQTQTTIECPECAAELAVGHVLQGEILPCIDCGADLEVRTVTPRITVALAPPVEEDWGE